jgi:hypothetical protein
MSLLKPSLRSILLLAIWSCSFTTTTALAVQREATVGRRPYSFPSYEQAVQTTDVEKYTDKVSYDRAVNDPKFEFQKLTYLSDGLRVVAYLYKPKSKRCTGQETNILFNLLPFYKTQSRDSLPRNGPRKVTSRSSCLLSSKETLRGRRVPGRQGEYKDCLKTPDRAAVRKE